MKKSLFILSLILLHFIFFILKICIGNFYINEDSYEYYNMAGNILSDFQFYCGDLKSNIDYTLYTKRPPLYSIFVLFSSFLMKSKIGILICQNVLSISSILIIKQIFENYYPKINTSLLFLLIVVSWNQFIYSNYIISEIFFQFLIVLLAFSLHLFFKYKSLKNLLFYQIVIVLLFLTKPVFYLFIFPNLILTFLMLKKIRIKLGYFSAVIPILFFLVYSFWNVQRTGSSDFSSIQGINLLHWNLYFFNQKEYGVEKAREINKQILNKSHQIENYAERQSFIKREAISHILKDPLGYMMFHISGCFRIFLDPGRFDISKFYSIESSIKIGGFLDQINKNGIKGVINNLYKQPIFILISLLIIFGFNVLKLIGFIWFWIKNYKKASLLFWILFFVIAYIVALTGPLGASRFFVPVLPIYLLFSVIGMSHLISIIKKRYYCTNTSLTFPSS
ncbi:hypothetical protein AB832_04755 [Flavobacteriaceae bacterium (ex Bugula neritina AB1)]|nr:hypothetical protein AB832_04755 [Flavobacteriaceae bacterium (ex Bugula neritina AB1)]